MKSLTQLAAAIEHRMREFAAVDLGKTSDYGGCDISSPSANAPFYPTLYVSDRKDAKLSEIPATGIAPQELVISGEPEFVAEAAGADGTVEGLAVAPPKHTFTLSGYLTDKTTFEGVGITFEHDGKYFICTGNQLTKAGKDFQKAQLTGVSYPGVTAPESSS